MSAINSIITKLFDIVLAPAAVSPWLGMALISCITGFVLLLVYRYTSNQRGIQAAKDRITAHLLEIVLYRDAMKVVMRGEARVMKNILSYLGFTIIPLACMLIPVALLFAQIELRYGSRPLKVGERAIISMKAAGGNTDLSKISLSAPRGIVVETESLRMPLAKKVDWRVKAGAAGRYRLEIDVEGASGCKRKTVTVTQEGDLFDAGEVHFLGRCRARAQHANFQSAFVDLPPARQLRRFVPRGKNAPAALRLIFQCWPARWADCL